MPTTLFGDAFDGGNGETFYLGIELHLQPPALPAFYSRPYRLTNPQWTDRVNFSYLFFDCTSAVLVYLMAEGRILFTPIIVHPKHGESVHGVHEFAVKRWVQELQLCIHSAGTGTFELQLLGQKDQPSA